MVSAWIASGLTELIGCIPSYVSPQVCDSKLVGDPGCLPPGAFCPGDSTGVDRNTLLHIIIRHSDVMTRGGWMAGSTGRGAASVPTQVAGEPDQVFFGGVRRVDGFLRDGASESRIANLPSVDTPGSEETALNTSLPVATSASS